jgi:glutamate synthase (NADPH/NADH) large chain
MVGHADRIAARTLAHPKARTLDFTKVLRPAARSGQAEEAGAAASTARRSATDDALIEGTRLSVIYGARTMMQVALTNADRAFGAALAGDIARAYGAEGLPDATIVVESTGTAGQSYGAFATRGMLLVLEGDANDYVGKGLSGGVLAVRPAARAPYKAHDHVVVGNTCLYGATSGRVFLAGRAGERFAVRNSGAVAVVEGVGDHGCEYMTGGVVVVLGVTGRNFGAGMSGGVAYVLDDDGAFASHVSRGTVDIEPLTHEDVGVVQALVDEHVAHTRSARGKSLLASWGKHKLVRVMPREWRRVLELRRTA